MTTRAAIAVAGLAAAGALAAALLLGGDTARFSGGFESGSLAEWPNGIHVCCPGRISIREQDGNVLPAEGRYFGRFEARPGDRPGIDRGYDRTHVEVKKNLKVVDGTELWYRWFWRVQPEFDVKAEWFIISQWHDHVSSKASNPNLTLRLTTDEQVVLSGRGGTRCSTCSVGSSEFSVPLGPLPQGRWVEVLMHVRHSNTDADGLVEMWMDGEKRAEVRRATIYSDSPNRDGSILYFKQGIYRKDQPVVSVLYLDGTRIGDREYVTATPTDTSTAGDKNLELPGLELDLP